MNSQQQLKRYEYSGGKEYIQRLKSVLGETTDIGLAGRLGIPKGTIATWMQRNTTPYEVSIIVHLATNLSLRWLLLGEGEPFESEPKEEVHDTSVVFEKEELSNGALKASGEMKFDQSVLEYYNIEVEHTKLIASNSELMMVNMSETNPVSGKYLIDIDGAISINHLQRLPGKKLAMSFGDSSIEVAENDITVLGKVVMVMGKA